METKTVYVLIEDKSLQPLNECRLVSVYSDYPQAAEMMMQRFKSALAVCYLDKIKVVFTEDDDKNAGYNKSICREDDLKILYNAMIYPREIND